MRAWSELDEFAFYRSREHGYYAGDDRRPTFIGFEPDGAAALKAEVHRKFDFHGAVAPNGGFIEVVLLHGDRSIPIYAERGNIGGPPRFLVEGWEVPIWVIGDPVDDDRLRIRVIDFADFVAYWVWQLTDHVIEEGALAERGEQLHMHISVSESEGWHGGEEQGAGEPFAVEVLGNAIRFNFNPSFVDLVKGADNAGERQFVSALAAAISVFATEDPLDEDVLQAIVDAVAPLGLKKKINVWDLREDPRLDDAGLPRYRPVQEADQSVLLDDLGQALKSQGFAFGPLDRDEADRALRASVAYFYERLVAIVAALNPDGVLEQLIALNEAVVVHQARRERAVPTEIACFASAAKTVENLAKEVPKISEAAIASRFLIEYVTASPPNGIRPMSMATYDELLALAAEINNMGVAREFHRYELTDTEISYLDSERIGFSRETRFERGRRDYLDLHAHTEIERRTQRLLKPPAEGDAERPEGLDELDDAMREEFGFTLTEFVEFHAALLNIGYDVESPVKSLSRRELAGRLNDESGWSLKRIEEAIALHVLEPRAEFLVPPSGRAADVYPWVFGREFSYIRRPLLLLRRPDNEEWILWGNRHLAASSQYFFSVCAGGRLHPRTQAMKRVLNKWREADARMFNDDVAALYAGERRVTDVRVKKIGKLRIEREPGQQISDIDVLVLDPKLRRILIVETKALAPARTPRELANERKNTFFGGDGKRSEIAKLLELTRWVKDHRREVLDHYGIRESKSNKWFVKSLMVVEAELLTPFVDEVEVQVLTIHQLREQLARKGR